MFFVVPEWSKVVESGRKWSRWVPDTKREERNGSVQYAQKSFCRVGRCSKVSLVSLLHCFPVSLLCRTYLSRSSLVMLSKVSFKASRTFFLFSRSRSRFRSSFSLFLIAPRSLRDFKMMALTFFFCTIPWAHPGSVCGIHGPSPDARPGGLNPK